MASLNHLLNVERRTAEAADTAAWPIGGIVVQSLPPTLNLYQLSELLHRAPATILSDRTRAPHRVPPAVEIPDARALCWLTTTVVDWMLNPADKSRRMPHRRPGRPKKAEQIASQRRQYGDER